MANSIWNNLTPAQQAYCTGLIVAASGALLVLFPGHEAWHAAGPANIGHTRLDCSECHTPAPGNFAGQALNNLLHVLRLSDAGSDFVFRPTGNTQCLACHDNPDDRHPVAKFIKPEFSRARQELGVQSCVNCHEEHLGVRVSVTPLACQYCHKDTVVSDDPIDMPHATLFRDQRWETCLGCHDFHGNHVHEVPLMMSQTFTQEQIQQYFGGGESPYGYRKLTVIQTMRSEP